MVIRRPFKVIAALYEELTISLLFYSCQRACWVFCDHSQRIHGLTSAKFPTSNLGCLRIRYITSKNLQCALFRIKHVYSLRINQFWLLIHLTFRKAADMNGSFYPQVRISLFSSPLNASFYKQDAHYKLISCNKNLQSPDYVFFFS